MRRALLLISLGLLVACDGGRERPRGAGPAADAGGPVEDAGAAAADGGAAPDAGPIAAYCGDQRCDSDESCGTCASDCGPCDCDPGFALHLGRCAPEAPEPFVTRLADEVCAHWNREFTRDVGTEWEPTFGSEDPCDPGVVSEASHANAIVRTNLYRWLAGMGPVQEEVERRRVQQACAVVLEQRGSLTHEPEMNVPCWTRDGFDGASSSNIAQAGGGLARSVDLYVGDRNVASLGHRRWVLNPSMVETTFGYKPPFSCMYAFSRGSNTPIDVQAYPPPGYVPAQAAEGEWSFRMDSQDFVDAAVTVEMSVDDGGYEVVASRVVGGNFGAGPVLAWDPTPAVWRAGRTVQVRLTHPDGRVYRYTVIFVDC